MKTLSKFVTIMKVCLLVVILFAYLTNAKLPPVSQGFYTLLADDTVSGYTSSDNWQPALYNYQIGGSNVMWFTFINPITMSVPPAFANLAKCRGQSGCPTHDQIVLFSFGGESYSNQVWPWLSSQSAAEAMAQTVSQWPTQYGCDGIDIDIEGTAGNDATSANNVVYFVQKLKSLNPNIIISLPVYGFPQVVATDNLVNVAFAPGSNETLIDSVGIMVYQDTESLTYVSNYADATSKWYGFPITVNVPTQNIMAGLQGSASDSVISQMGQSVISENLGGLMVWFASVWDNTRNQKAFTYGGDDSSSAQSNQWKNNMRAINSTNF